MAGALAVGPYGALLEAVRGTRWPARRAVCGGLPGAHLARTRGVASEFAEYRPYRQGDDPRRLDWKLLARSDRAFIRLAPDRAMLGTLVAVDASASMGYPIPSLGKWVAAKRLTVACAAIAHGEGDPVGLTIAGAAGLTRLVPRTRRGVVAEIARALDACRPGGNTQLSGAFVGAAARVLIVTDGLGDLDAMRRAARAHIAAGGEVIVAHVVARLELEPPHGTILATDPENAALARPLSDVTRAAYRAAFDAWRGDVARRWREDGVSHHEFVDDEPADVVVRRVVSLPLGARARA